MSESEPLAALTVKIPKSYVEWLSEHHWDAKMSRAAYAASLLMSTIDAVKDTSAE